MKFRLNKYSDKLTGTVNLESSKSESNRALIVNALAGGAGELSHLSNARDTNTMLALLSSNEEVLDVKDAGTTMRFLTAYLAVTGTGQIITGTDRMKKRPIGPLVDALRQLGATIEFLEEEGYPPLRIHKIKKQQTNLIRIPGNISSQYISALMMIAPTLPNGLSIELTTEVFSRPYIELTIALMEKFGVNVVFQEKTIHVDSQRYVATDHEIEGDWSGASYWFGFTALAPEESSLELPRIYAHSPQGDHVIAKIMAEMGVLSTFSPGKVTLQNSPTKATSLNIDFRNCPDLAQTVMAIGAVSGITLNMTGLESLKIKETDRIEAMRTELAKLGAVLQENGSKWILRPSSRIPESIEVDTYEDHRMAMAFAPLSQIMDVTIDDPSVVNKSYPGFWDEVRKLGVKIEEIN